jgi:glutathione S-transferase
MAEGAGMMANGYTLVIGDKNLSSWSLRPWLALKHCHIPFEEVGIRLRQPDSKAEILRHTPSGKVPALKTKQGVVWDTLAILEYLAERHPEHRLWPQDEEPRAAARSISAEMHSGFATLRNDLPMDLLSRLPSPPIGEPLASDIRRIVAIWKDTRARFSKGGPFLLAASPVRTPCMRRGNALPHLWGLILPATGTKGRPQLTSATFSHSLQKRKIGGLAKNLSK